MLALYSAIDHQTGTSGDLPRDFAAVKEELYKTSFMEPHKSRRAVEAHSAALQEYLLFAELLRYPGYDWRPVPGVFGMRDCNVNETLLQYVPDLAARRGEAVTERRELMEALGEAGSWQIDFTDAGDASAVAGASEEGGRREKRRRARPWPAAAWACSTGGALPRTTPSCALPPS